MKPRHLLLLLLALITSINVSAYTWTDANGTVWNFTVADGNATLYKDSNTPCISGTIPTELTVPTTVYNGETAYTVTTIGDYAFNDCNNLTSVTIPEGVTSIGRYAFYSCDNLTSVNIPEGVTSIGSEAFESCSRLTSVTIPEGVTSIGSYAFYYCYALTSVTIPKSISNIDYYVFRNCNALQSVYISDLTKWINLSVGDYNDGLYNIKHLYLNGEEITDLVIPEGIKTIRSNAFRGLVNLTSVTIPESVTTINGYAFRDCTKLTSITIPQGVTSISGNAFQGCYTAANNFTNNSSLDEVANSYWGATIYDTLVDGLCIKSNKIVFAYNYLLNAEVTIPEGVTAIEENAFKNCTNMTSITIPEGVTSIGNSAFSGCTNLTSITTGSANPSFGSNVFSNCSKFNELHFTASTPAASSTWPSSCLWLVPDDAVTAYKTAWPTYAYRICPESLLEAGNITFADDAVKAICVSNWDTNGDGELSYAEAAAVTSISGFNGNTTITSFNELQYFTGLTSIRSSSFYNCSSLTSITIPEGVTSIGEWAFFSCYALQSVYISDLTSWINLSVYEGNDALYNTQHLYLNEEEITNLVIPEGVTTIRSNAFSGLVNLTSVTIPESVTSIGDHAFWGANNVEFTMNSTTPATLLDGGNWFNSSNVFYVPAEAKTAYQTAENWTNYATQMIVESSWNDANVTVTAQESSSDVLTKIGEENASNVVSLKVTGSINGYDIMVMRNKMLNLRHLDLSDASIVANDYEYYSGNHTEDNVLGTNSFSNLKLFSVKVPRTIKSIVSAFNGCGYLKDVTMYEGLELVGYNAFNGCSRLENVTMAEGIKTIGSGAFRSCSNLKTIVLPEGVEIIQHSAFISCGKLENITLPQSLKEIQGSYDSYYGAFNGCSRLKSIALPPGLTTIGAGAFNGTGLTEVHIPEMITSIGDYAFNTSTIKKVYAYTVEPVSIGQNTFSNYTTIDLYVPKMTESYYNYYWDTQWSQFQSISENDHDYTSFYINKDYEQGDGKDIIQGVDDQAPDATLNDESGYIKTGEETQELGDVEQNVDGYDTAASIIAEDDGSTQGNLNVFKLKVNISVAANRWYFFCFPYEVTIANCEYPGNYVWKEYNGLLRATTQAGWQTVTDATLTACKGYAFCSSKGGKLTISFSMPTFGGDRPKTLDTYTCDNAQHASWNFVGNPYSSYYEALADAFDAPITRWNGSSYEAFRPGDDDCHLRPYEAFFVQKPVGVEEFDFKAESRETYRQGKAKKEANVKAMRMKGLNAERLLMNLTLTDSENNTIDRTRVVLNNKKSHNYELDCDAAKFLSNEAAAQLYSIEGDGTQYAINERPAQGDIRLGLTVAKDGALSIGASRMDQPALLVDTELGVTTDLSVGNYTFSAKAGTYNNRFFLRMGGDQTGLTNLRQQTGVVIGTQDGGIAIGGAEGQTVDVFSTNGMQVASHQGNGFIEAKSGVYVVKVGNNSAKVSVR